MSAQERGKIISLDLLTTLLLMWPKTQLAFWAAGGHLSHIELFTHKHPQVFLPWTHLNPFSTQPVLVIGIAPQTLHLALMNLACLLFAEPMAQLFSQENSISYPASLKSIQFLRRGGVERGRIPQMLFMLWQIWESSQYQELDIIRKVSYLTTVHISSSASCALKISWTTRYFCYLCNNSGISVKIHVYSGYWEQELQVVTHWSYCKHFCKEKFLIENRKKI